MRQHLQNVIDHMGPETPHYRFTTTTSTECLDGDNEESYFESTSIISSVVQIKQIQMQEQAFDTLDSSEVSAIPPDTQRTDCQDAEVQVPSKNSLEKGHQHVSCERPCYCPNPSYGYHYQPCYIPYPNFPQPLPICCSPPIQPQEQQQPTEMIHPCREAVNVPPKPVQSQPKPCHHPQGRYVIPKHNCKGWSFLKCFRKERPKNEFIKLYVENPSEHHPPEKLVFDLVAGIPQPCTNTISTNTVNNVVKSTGANTSVIKTKCSSVNAASVVKCHGVCTSKLTTGARSICSQTPCGTPCSRSEHVLVNRISQDRNRGITSCKGDLDTKIEVYYFDHGNSAYYCTTDSPPIIDTDVLGEKSEQCAKRFWAESFGTVYIGITLFTTFVLQFFKFLLYGLIRPLTVGLLQLACDYFFKPFLAILFNGFVQPILIFFYNVATSLRDLCDPIAEGCGYFLHELAFLCRSIRLFDYKSQKPNKECIREKRSKCCASPVCKHKKQQVINIPPCC
ncbi:uncharacterized protein LOC108738021 isoform X2 [Agrilus planipennis]|nr:uncharacterized protein LOC108738021 isoform X2 [Agrilus planipennis]